MTIIPAGSGSPSYPDHGLKTAETGINATSHEEDYAPEFIDPMLNFQGERRGEAVGAIATAISLKGEILAVASAPMTHTFVAACTLANTTNLFAPATGIILLNSAKVSLGNTKWIDVDLSYRRNKGITSV